jgi:hypothetical protein
MAEQGCILQRMRFLVETIQLDLQGRLQTSQTIKKPMSKLRRPIGLLIFDIKKPVCQISPGLGIPAMNYM